MWAIHFNLTKQKVFLFVFFFIMLIAPARVFSFTPFFFDVEAFSVDENDDGGDDYILARFDIDLDEEVTANITVNAKLYNSTGVTVDTEAKSYQVIGQQAEYYELRLDPVPNIAGTYSIYLTITNSSETASISNISYNPESGSKPIPYFADIIINTKPDSIVVEFDVDLVQEILSDVKVEITLSDSDGIRVDSQFINYKSFFEDIDYKTMTFKPSKEDLYLITFMVYPQGSGSYTDSYLANVIYPPGSGAFFKTYKSSISGDSLRVDFDVDLYYNIKEIVSVEVILYDSTNDPVDYKYISYFTYGTNNDAKNVMFETSKLHGDIYYVELIIYVDNYPSTYGYITDIALGSFIINAKANNNGKIIPSGEVILKYGASQKFAITPSEGYHILDVKVDDESKGALDTYEFKDIKANHSIEATFAIDKYTINVKAGEGGNISPAENITVEHGASQKFTITQTEGYRIADVKIDNESKGALDNYEFKDIKANHSIEATFATDKYTINVKAGEGGNISPAENITVEHGASQKFAITPSEGYHILDVKVDDESKGALDNYEFKDIKANHSIEATFAIDKYTINVKAGEGGNISPAENITVEHGASQKFTITQTEGYHIADVKINGESKGKITEYIFNNVKSDNTIEASFEIDYIKGDVNEDGAIKSNDAQIVLLYLVQLKTLTEHQIMLADIDDNGIVNIKDVMIILQKSVGLLAPPQKSHGQISMKLPELHGIANEYVTMPIKIDNIKDVACGFIRLSYNSKVLKAIQVNSDNNMLLASNVDEDGTVYIGFVFNDNPNGMALSDIKFQILSDDVSNISITEAEFYSADRTKLVTKQVDSFFRSWAIPAENNALFQNYPNPFNPETWIPFQLKSDSNVSIVIYSQTGEMVRTLDLGHKPAGVYITNGRAGYWDGKNSSGEKVASGVYFYSLKTGKFHAIRKMIILE